MWKCKGNKHFPTKVVYGHGIITAIETLAREISSYHISWLAWILLCSRLGWPQTHRGLLTAEIKGWCSSTPSFVATFKTDNLLILNTRF